MPSRTVGIALFFDFDNTITLGDVLDQVIERYSESGAWRDWEAEWQAGRMSAAECLRLQMGDLRVSPEDLHGFMSGVADRSRVSPHRRVGSGKGSGSEHLER